MARKAIITKVCTKSGRTYSGTFEELTEWFYRDKSQKDGLSPWDKQSEREYNKAYRQGLKDADAARKANITDDGALAAFEEAMVKERVVRRNGTRNKAEVATAKAAKSNAKATTKARASARSAKKATPRKKATASKAK